MDAYRKKIIFRSNHRGIKEMDLILGNYAKNNVERMNDKELKTFDDLIDIPDPELYEWFSNRGTEGIPSKFKDLVNDILLKIVK
ncbi:MAG: succinate dehydrogenase assembly factor 2 [Pseudomonadota bacterium]|nr:succinate dehydrogenase assembly factor 2 [Pseudomonadota bacterium]